MCAWLPTIIQPCVITGLVGSRFNPNRWLFVANLTQLNFNRDIVN